MSKTWRRPPASSVSGRFSQRGPWRATKASAVEIPAPVLGTLLARINRDDLEELIAGSSHAKGAPKIENCQLVGSYNWLNRKSPTILIPGAPPKWTPTQSLERLPEDTGPYYRDKNAAMYSKHVFQPALEAVLKDDPEFELDKIDLVACGSTLGSLLRFVRNIGGEFRMVVEVVGSTVFLVRRVNSPKQTIPGVHGYGHSFPAANTTWDADVKGSESHQRIIQYDFAGMSCMLRYEGDGYLPNLYEPCIPRVEATPATYESLLTALEEGNTVSAHGVQENIDLLVKTGGQSVPQSAIFDLKTRSFRKSYDQILDEELPRLWLAQIPNFVVGFHRAGVFIDVRIQDVRQEMQQWEKEQESTLNRFATLLRTLIAFAGSQEDGRFEVVFNGESEELELREVGGDVNCCISDSLKARWMNVYADDDGEQEEEEAIWSDSDSEKDFTACSASSCGYCGHCDY